MKGRIALITGGARGIGLGIATTFLEAGARVMIADLGARAPGWNYDLSDATALESVLAEHGAAGELRATEVDVTDAASCRAAVQATLDAYGGLDVLVNNAGVVQSGPIDAFGEDDWDRVFDVNAKGIFLMTQAALFALRRSADAVIINTASIAGKQGYPNMVAYCGSKFAAIGITQALAAELAPENIRVNAICPGMVGTAMWLEHLLPSNAVDPTEKAAAFEQAMREAIPLGRPQTPADMGQAALFLARATNVTGVSLSIAGGFEMG